MSRSDAPHTICEDDAILHRQFTEKSQRLVAQLGADWDLVAWGWNFDSVLFAELLPRLGPCLVAFDQNAMRRNASQYVHSRVDPNLFKLVRALGTVCYTISPGGARKLIGKVLPIRRMDVAVPGLDRALPNIALDVMINNFYPELDCYVAFPPLALTLNDHAGSTVQPPRD